MVTALYLPVMSGLFTWGLLRLPFWITLVAVTVPTGLWLRSVSLRWMIRRQVKTNPDSIGRSTVEINPTGVIEAARQIRIELPWRKLGSPTLTADYLLIPIDPLHSFIVPRRAFASPEAEEEFVRCAREWRNRATELSPSAVSA
jgi:hypothetical protein